MKVPTYLIEYTPVGGVSQSINVESIRANYSMGKKKDTFELKLPYSEEYSFEPNDRIKISLGYTGSNTLIMDGIVTDVTNQVEGNRDSWLVKGNNILEILLNHQVRADYGSQSAGYIINNLLQNASDSQPENRKITLSTTLSVTTGATKSVNYYSEYKPVFQHIETISQNQYTGDGDYIYYLDTATNELVWKPKPTSAAGVIQLTDGTLSINRTKNEDEVVNFLYINAGPDLNGASIHTYQTNIPSINKLGYRTKYLVKRDIANWYSQSTGITDNSQFREDVKLLAKAYGQDILDSFDDGTDKAVVVVEGNAGYNPGQSYNLILTEAGFTQGNPKLLYLDDVEYSFDKRGYWTTLKLKEEIRGVTP